MKLKQRPEDFGVEEVTSFAVGAEGDHSLYRLEKTGWTTPDAIQAICRRWKLDRRRIGCGGLKDRHACTVQHLTIHRGPERNLAHERVVLTYLGKSLRPFTSTDIAANRFTIVLRAMAAAEVTRAENALRELGATGVPNYFDDQRFGSVGDPPEFVAKEMVFGRFERALGLALAAPYEHDPAAVRKEKQLLRECWGRWPECKAKLPKGHARSLVDYLVTHPTDFKGAVARLRPDLQGLYLSAYQSHLWNRMLAHWLTERFGERNLSSVALKLGPMPVPNRVPDDLRERWDGLELPLPSSRLKPELDAHWSGIVDAVLQDEGLTLRELRIKSLQKPFFSKGLRAGCLRPVGLMHAVATDDCNAGKQKLTLSFELPRGCYATMVVKRITLSGEKSA